MKKIRIAQKATAREIIAAINTKPQPPPIRYITEGEDKEKVKLGYVEDLKAAKQKYRKLYEEICQIEDEHLRSNMIHTHSKLGMFINDFSRNAWSYM